eukprot:763670-Hanusia_phi.AAC.2
MYNLFSIGQDGKFAIHEQCYASLSACLEEKDVKATSLLCIVSFDRTGAGRAGDALASPPNPRRRARPHQGWGAAAGDRPGSWQPGRSARRPGA